MNNWDKKLAREAMKWGFSPVDSRLYEESLEEKFDDPWKVMSPEDRTLANKLLMQALRTMPASPKQKEIRKRLNDLLVKYKLKSIPEERLKEAYMMAESFTMQNAFDLRLLLLALLTNENVAKIRQQFQTKEKPPAATATSPKAAPAPAAKAAKKD